MANLKRVLITGTVPGGIQLGKELARANPETRFDVMIAENFDETSLDKDQYQDGELENLHYIRLKYMYVLKQPIRRDNLTNFYMAPGTVSLFDALEQYMNRNANLYDFIITVIGAFQRWRWVNELKKRKVVFCPDTVCADLEYDKLFAKQILSDLGIPTPEFRILNQSNLVEDVGFLEFPAVVKCNIGYTGMGFATWVFKDHAYKNILPQVQKAATAYDPRSLFYSERFISGPEISAHFLCNGKEWVFAGAARDYKKMFDGDQGMNTSGAGTYAPAETWTQSVQEQVFGYMDKLIPYLGTMGMPFRGMLYLGIIIDQDGTPQIIEINTRPGGPEWQTILKTTDNSNLLENLYRAATGDDLLPITFNGQAGVSVAIMNKSYSAGLKLETKMPAMYAVPPDVDLAKSAQLSISNNIFGVLTAQGETRQDAAGKIYQYLSTVDCRDFFYRRDIGKLK